MCGPAALAIGASAVSAVGAIQGGMQAQAQGRYQARVAEMNARLTAEQARDAQERGRVQQTQLARKYSALQGEQTAAMAANGIDTSFGSAADVAKDTAMFAAEDSAALSSNVYNEVRGFDIKGANLKAEAQADRQAGKGAMIQGIFGAGSTLLGGASQYSKLKKDGY